MSIDDVQRLYRLQGDFEKEPHNMQAAYELFTELNKLGKYNTVMRLYDKYELVFVSQKDHFAERMQSQYELAKDNIASLGINLNEDSTRVTAQSLNKIMFSK